MVEHVIDSKHLHSFSGFDIFSQFATIVEMAPVFAAHRRSERWLFGLLAPSLMFIVLATAVHGCKTKFILKDDEDTAKKDKKNTQKPVDHKKNTTKMAANKENITIIIIGQKDDIIVPTTRPLDTLGDKDNAAMLVDRKDINSSEEKEQHQRSKYNNNEEHEEDNCCCCMPVCCCCKKPKQHEKQAQQQQQINK